MADIIVSIEEIKEVANSLKKKGADILAAYEQHCSSALNQSTECLKISGINPEEFFKKLNEIYKNTNDRLLVLSNFLINDVANNYDRISAIISNKFNGDLGSQIGGILGITTTPGGFDNPKPDVDIDVPDSNPGGGQGSGGGDNSGTPTTPQTIPTTEDTDKKDTTKKESETLTDKVNNGEMKPEEAVEQAKEEREKQLYEMSDAYLTDQVNSGKMSPEEAARIGKEREKLYSNKSLTEQVNNGTLSPEEAVKRATSKEGQAYAENQRQKEALRLAQEEKEHQQALENLKKRNEEWMKNKDNRQPISFTAQQEQAMNQGMLAEMAKAANQSYKEGNTKAAESIVGDIMAGKWQRDLQTPVVPPKTQSRPRPQAPRCSAMGQSYNPTPAPTIPSYAAASGVKQTPTWAVGGNKWKETYKQAQQNNPGMAAAMAEQRRTQR